MSLTKKILDWAEKRAVGIFYNINLNKKPVEPFSEVVIDIFAMGF